MILILCVIILPEPVYIPAYFLMRKFFPEHPITKYLESHINNFFDQLKKIKNILFQKKKSISCQETKVFCLDEGTID